MTPELKSSPLAGHAASSTWQRQEVLPGSLRRWGWHKWGDSRQPFPRVQTDHLRGRCRSAPGSSVQPRNTEVKGQRQTQHHEATAGFHTQTAADSFTQRGCRFQCSQVFVWRQLISNNARNLSESTDSVLFCIPVKDDNNKCAALLSWAQIWAFSQTFLCLCPKLLFHGQRECQEVFTRL